MPRHKINKVALCTDDTRQAFRVDPDVNNLQY